MWTLSALILTLVALASATDSETSRPSWIRKSTDGSTSENLVKLSTSTTDGNSSSVDGRSRNAKDLFDLIGLGTGPEVDPYLAKANRLCLDGDLSECFKSKALSSLDDFFNKDGYHLNDHVKVVRMPEAQLGRLYNEPYEFSTQPRHEEPEWDQFVKFLLRKIEKFVKSTGVEVKIPRELTDDGRYSPRFVDEIATEIDILEDKNESVFSRTKLKKLFIPLLIILKLFKLKLLLFLPMILGLASFKKLLGFLAIIVPGLIGFFKLCKPQLYSSSFGGGHAGYYSPPQYSPAGVASGSPMYYSHNVPYQHYKEDYTGYNGKTIEDNVKSGGTVSFQDDSSASASSYQQLAYKGYSEQFRNSQ